MARPRTFDEDAVLDAAADEFRVHGFADTSTERLCVATGVRRSSLYNAFVSKEELFVRALERYTRTTRQRQAEALEVDGSGGDRVRALVELVLNEERIAARDGHAAGCMVVHTLMSPEVRERDPRVARILDDDVERRLGAIADALRIGQSDGSVRADVDPREGALLLTTLIAGLRVTAQAGTDPEVLQRVAESGLGALLS
ncbi:TetR/AcrR family transcriptional regulator [Spiractinospora alimapuensis]|uniref:TetR/AcrR family transcriptional regulator n=1 Tax=Spiractinospora alimapuensis TaxID=2820884 RepID=UPI001F2EA8EF|nr:TetR/AcrR family transcriptional regulator [Spiractinospora alimapuensis]QVQ52100.1 TetR/AcrR family transcriptional regulator [Spiractinospora alimapuensis]